MKAQLYIYCILFFALLLPMRAGAQIAPRAFAFFRGNGQAVEYSEMISDLAKADLVFFGEQHNCALSHWMELKVLEAIHERWGESMCVGMEMFERDVQLVLDEFIDGRIEEERFVEESRAWSNYSTDYAPIVDFCKEHSLSVIATNVPRRYARIVARHGGDSLSTLSSIAKQYLLPDTATLIIDDGMKSFFGMMAGMGRASSNPDHYAQAQALKDAVMAYSLRTAIIKCGHIIHFNGMMHSVNHSGILDYLKRDAPRLRLATITVIRQDQLDTLGEESLQTADFILVVPSDMSRSY